MRVLLLSIVVTVFLISCGSGGSSSDVIGSGDDGVQSVWRLFKIEYDNDNDGTADYVETNIYDANGNMIKWEQDYGNDGTDIVETFTYDTNGTLIKWEQEGAVAYMDYDTNGNLIKALQENSWVKQRKKEEERER